MGGDGTGGGGGLPPAHLLLGQQHFRLAERNTLPSQQTPLPSRTPLPTQLKSPQGWVSFQDTHLTPLTKAAATQVDPVDQRAYIRHLETCLRQVHHWHTSAL